MNRTVGQSDPAWRPAEPSRPVRAFTLVELLTVVAVLALLLAVLMPSLRSAKYLARLALCKARLHDLNNGLAAYAAQNRGILPRFDDAASSAVNLWDVNLNLYDHLRRRYGLPHESFFCPLQPAELVDQTRGVWKACVGGRFYRMGYCFWMPFRSGHGLMPPSPGDGQNYTTPGDRAFAGPGSVDDPNAVNPILSDIVFTYAPCGAPTQTTDLGSEDLGLYTYSQHLSGRLLESIHSAWLDGHVERIFAPEVRPRFLSRNNYWNWR